MTTVPTVEGIKTQQKFSPKLQYDHNQIKLSFTRTLFFDSRAVGGTNTLHPSRGTHVLRWT